MYPYILFVERGHTKFNNTLQQMLQCNQQVITVPIKGLIHSNSAKVSIKSL